MMMMMMMMMLLLQPLRQSLLQLFSDRLLASCMPSVITDVANNARDTSYLGTGVVLGSNLYILNP